MKKTVASLIFTFALFVVGYSQNFPNADFESWINSTTPEGWSIALNGTVDDNIPLQLNFGTRSMNSHSGTYALKIQPQFFSVSAVNIPGFCQLGETGTINVSQNSLAVLGGLATGDFSNFSLSNLSDLAALGSILARGTAISEIPSEIRAWVKFFPDAEAADKVTLIVTAYKSSFLGRVPVAYGSYSIDTLITEYTQIQIPVSKIGSDNQCDSITFVMMVGGSNTSPATEFLIDDISVLFNTWGIDESHPQAFAISPNPAHNSIHITPINEDSYSFQLIDITGKILFKSHSLTGAFDFDVSDYAKGFYTLLMNNSGNISTSKIIIQ